MVKAILNLFAGNFSDRWGRKKVLVLGWLFGLPVPFILLFAPNWNWIIFANILLGINQGLAWSMTVNMKVDLVGKKDRGLALGLNEFAGYISVAIVGFATGYLALTAYHLILPQIKQVEKYYVHRNKIVRAVYPHYIIYTFQIYHHPAFQFSWLKLMLW